MGEVVQLFPNKPLSRNAEKLEAFKQGLEQGIIMITLDATQDKVSVPSQFSKSVHLSLNYSYQYQLPDFAFDEEGVSATLSFDEGYFYCLVPWEAVYRIGTQIWPEDLP